MKTLTPNKAVRLGVGLMSGTSVDGIDSALVEISGSPDYPHVALRAFENKPYPPEVRRQIFELFEPKAATVERLGSMNFLLGELYAAAALSVITKGGVTPEQVDFVASHGQTIYHEPCTVPLCGSSIRYTVQIGEGAVIAQRTGLPCVSDFRVADMAAGGQGAPLVPFTEFLLYRRQQETVLLQNIGGIGNITVLPAGCCADEVYAFDTGPGNMLIDGLTAAITKGQQSVDTDGRIAASGKVNPGLLSMLQQDSYYSLPLPKTTGREHFGSNYVAAILAFMRQHHITDADGVATVTNLTAWSIADAYNRYIQRIHPATRLIVGGGGSYNPVLLSFLQQEIGSYGVKVATQEAYGGSSDAKEAIAFALLGDRTLQGLPGSLPGVTGASSSAILGKISLPPYNVNNHQAFR